jgi:hypothetical protein
MAGSEAMRNLAPCPCGKTPTDITVVDIGQGYKYAGAVPNCCSEWMIEFRTVSYELDSEATKLAAFEAWNNAPRGKNETETN